LLATAFAVLALSAPVPGFVPDTRRAEAWALQRRGVVTFAVRTNDHVWGRRLDRVVPSVSTLKALLLVTYLRAVRGRALTRADRALLAPMIRRSANAPASAIVSKYGVAWIEAVARKAGMRSFKLRDPWGNSDMTARDLTRFALRMEALMPERHRAYGMHLLNTITPSQRWGIARAVPQGWTLYFKSGWGSGTGRVENQVALLKHGEQRIAVAILTTSQGDHAYGTRTLQGIAKRLLHRL
jgi:beta-lactamase class A